MKKITVISAVVLGLAASFLTAMPGVPGVPGLSAVAAKAATAADLQPAMDSNGTRIITVATNGQVNNYWKKADGFWYGPAGIGGTARSDSPVTIDDSGNYVVFINSSGSVVEDTRDASTGVWSGPTAIGGTARAGSPLAFSGNGSTVAFVNSSGNVVADTLSGGTWSGPAAIGGTARSDSPMAINDNATHVYFIDTSGYVTNDWVSNGAWTGASRIGGQARAGSAMATSTSGNIVAFIDPNGYVVNDWISNNAWSGPAEMGGTAEAGSPLAVNGAPNRVYFVNSSGDVVNDWVANGTWTGPAGIGGTAESGSGLATMAENGNYTVAFFGSSGLEIDWYGPSNWHGPGNPDTITANIQGVNWPVDISGESGKGNYQNAPLVINGLSASDTPAQAETAAETIVGQLYSDTGGNTVRLPINEATVSSSYWSTYVGAIEGALTKGNVILTYWAYENGKPDNMSNYWAMWGKVVSQFSGDPDVFYEPINEPYGYSTASALVDDVYSPWLSNYSSVPRQRVILDGTGYADHVAPVGSLVSGTLLSVHDYTWYSSSTLSESGWSSHLSGEIGGYGSRTVLTEWGAPMTTGTGYDTASSDNTVSYVRGITDEAHSLGIGSTYWPGIGIADSYRLFTISGTSLTLTNQSGLDRLKYGWGQ